MPIPFCDILGVESVAYRGGAKQSNEDVHDSPQRRSCAMCLPWLGKDDHHSFVIYSKVRHMELSCASASASQKWIATIQAAVLLGKEKVSNDEVLSEQSTWACSRESFMIQESEQSSDSYSSEGALVEMERFEMGDTIDSPLCKVPRSHIAEPGRCLSGSCISALSPSSPVAALSLPTPPLPCRIGADSEEEAYDDAADAEPLGSPFVIDTEGLEAIRDVIQLPVPAIKDSLDTKGDLQALLVEAVLSQPSSTCSGNAWKRPQQPTVEKPHKQPSISPCPSLEGPQVTLPTIDEETTAHSDDTTPTLRERFLARGVSIPPDIEIP